MSYRKTMKVGFVGFIYTPPVEIPDPVDYLEWQINKAAELGCQILHPVVQVPDDEKILNRVKQILEDKKIELEIGMPQEVFQLAGPNAKEAREVVLKRIKVAKFLGSSIMRNGYGRLVAKTSRFNRDFPLKQHMQLLIDNLKEAAKLVEDQGILYALENHCDFKGKEFVEIFDAVNSANVGSALDTANGYTVYCDANEDVEVLAPYALTTHIKDMKIIDFPTQYGTIPYQAFGCALGEGNVDIERALELLDKKSPQRNGLHLVVEQGWVLYEEGADKAVESRKLTEKNLKYLQNWIARD